jgi:serine phosphatase RsbU (regulator of sigma subunit)
MGAQLTLSHCKLIFQPRRAARNKGKRVKMAETEISNPGLKSNPLFEQPTSQVTSTRSLWLARLGWVLLAAFTIWLFIATADDRIETLNRMAMVYENRLEALGLASSFMRNFLMALDAFTFGSFALVSLVVFVRKLDNVYGIFTSSMMIMMGASLTRPFTILPSASYAETIGVVFLAAFTTSSIIYFLYSFPDGRFIPIWLRWVAFGWILWTFIWHLGPVVLNPHHFEINTQPLITFLGWMGGGVVAASYRYYKKFTPTERQQTKWVMFGTLIAGLAYFNHIYLLRSLIPGVIEPTLVRLIYETAGVLVLDLAMMAFPLGVAFSILRYKLWDIDLIIRRTLIYTLVTALLFAFYIGMISAMQMLIYRPLGQPPVVIVALSTLVVSALFTPVRKGVQRIVDRRFYRTRYDQARTVASLGEILRYKADLEEIIEEIQRTVLSVLHPSRLCLWLVPLEGGITSDQAPNCGDFEPELIQELSALQNPVSLDELNPTSRLFQHMLSENYALVVPLVSQDELVGVLNLGPRLSDQAYIAQDRHTLALLASQIAPTLQAAQLAREQRLEALEHQRVESDLRVAGDVQRTLLPQVLPDMPGWQVDSFYQPALALGGDFYDLFALRDGRIGVVIGDVSSKGIPAALLMSSTRVLLRTLAQEFDSPGDVLFNVNNKMVGDIPNGMFVTCMYAILDPLSGRFDFANAGHNPPFVRRSQGVDELRARGMPLGLMPDMPYEEQHNQVDLGDWVFFFSDGLIEAHNPDGEMFSTLRLCTRLAAAQDGQTFIPTLVQYLADFSGTQHEQEDDITLLVLQRAATGRNNP